MLDDGDGGVGRRGNRSGWAASFAFGAAPRDDGLVYPGAIPARSFLFTGGAIEAIGAPDRGGSFAAVRRWLDDRLAERGATPLAQRHAVLAYGSNRSPAQLRSKFAESEIDPVIPVLAGRVTGLSVVFAAAIARYGAVPATLTDDPGASTEVSVTLLDDRQLALVDETERGHDRPLLDVARHPLVVDDGRAGGGVAWGEVAAQLGVSGEVGCYRSRRSVLTWAAEPIRLAEVGSTGSVLVARSQIEVHEAFVEVWAALGERFTRGRPVATPREVVDAVVGDSGLHERVNRALDLLVAQPFGLLGARGGGPTDHGTAVDAGVGR